MSHTPSVPSEVPVLSPFISTGLCFLDVLLRLSPHPEGTLAAIVLDHITKDFKPAGKKMLLLDPE